MGPLFQTYAEIYIYLTQGRVQKTYTPSDSYCRSIARRVTLVINKVSWVGSLRVFSS
jgi:hypothetical protein